MSGRVLVTAALPYANGSIHLGHLLEAIQTDVYVRARRLAGDDVIFMWAADTHGTPIELRARKEGITPEALIERAHAEHAAVFRDFGIGSDIYYTTHSEETRRHAERIFEAMRDAGHIHTRVTTQLYCPNDQMFLPDRFVRGQCPKCGALDQYGDSCEVCGSTYAPSELKDPHCSICGTTPVPRDSEHLFVALAEHEAFLRGWLRAPEAGGRTRLQPTVRNYVMRWVEDGLRDWDISRDPPYFGFAIPGYEGKKFFYVWFDAPVGYIGATEKWCGEHGRDMNEYWRGDAEIVHVIGKDIVYFHTLFWPAMLHAAGYTTPARVQVHGWLTVNGEKMSKSRGTFILGRTYLEHLPADYLRYYFAAKLGGEQDDIDLSMEDFAARVNAELVNKAANLASRCVKFVHQRLGATLGAPAADAAPLLERARARLAEVPGLYREFESARALRLAIEIAEDFNVYVTEAAPWKLATSDPERARAVCSAAIEAGKIVAAILKPVLPGWAEKTERMLRLPRPLDFANAGDPLPAGHAIDAYEILAERLDPALLAAIVEASKATLGGGATVEAAAPAHEYEVEPLAAETTIDGFKGVDLRVGVVQSCVRVKRSDKLLQLGVDLGPLGTRTIFSGIALSYSPEQLVGKRVVVFANLKPRKMAGGVSEGMILAAGASDDAITVLELDPRSRPGDRIS